MEELPSDLIVLLDQRKFCCAIHWCGELCRSLLKEDEATVLENMRIMLCFMGDPNYSFPQFGSLCASDRPIQLELQAHYSVLLDAARESSLPAYGEDFWRKRLDAEQENSRITAMYFFLRTGGERSRIQEFEEEFFGA